MAGPRNFYWREVGVRSRLIWRGPAVLTGGGSGIGRKGVRLTWQGAAVLAGGGQEKGHPVNLAGPRHFDWREVGGKVVG